MSRFESFRIRELCEVIFGGVFQLLSREPPYASANRNRRVGTRVSMTSSGSIFVRNGIVILSAGARAVVGTPPVHIIGNLLAIGHEVVMIGDTRGADVDRPSYDVGLSTDADLPIAFCWPPCL